MIPGPTADQLAAAFRGGARVLFGWPTRVPAGDHTTHLLDLAAAWRGDPDPWVSTTHDDEWVEVVTAAGRAVGLGDREAYGADVLTLDEVRAALPREADRHSPVGDAARRRAGSLALKIGDAHLRAAALAWCDGWGAVCSPDRLIDDDAAHGCLYAPLEGHTTPILQVECPSTGRVYAHAVPESCQTAAAARRWMMRLGDDEDVEIES